MIDFKALAAPFSDNEVEWRIQRGGVKNGKPWALIVPYVQSRAIMDRLDSVAGTVNWRNEFKEFRNGIVCGISILVNNEWVTKWDGASETNIESFKGGLSDAMKRAAVQWGIGRHLYDTPVTFAKIHDNGKHKAKINDNGTDVWINWDAPSLGAERAKPKPEAKKKSSPTKASSKKALDKYLAELSKLSTAGSLDALKSWGADNAAAFADDLIGDDIDKLRKAYSLALTGADDGVENDDKPEGG